MNFYVQGKKTEVIIDDQFPTKDNHFAFANPVDSELWVVILEKAWCKLFDEYTAAEGG